MFEEQLQNVLVFLQANPIIAVILGSVVVTLFYSKPKEMFKLLVFCIFIAVVFYFLTLFAGTVDTGAKQSDQMIHKTKDALGERGG